MTYLIPPLPRTGDGLDVAHIDEDGRPLCGAVLGAAHAASGWLYAYEVCPACGRASERAKDGQMGLFDGQIAEGK
jgi:hypothetical protein